MVSVQLVKLDLVWGWLWGSAGAVMGITGKRCNRFGDGAGVGPAVGLVRHLVVSVVQDEALHEAPVQ